MPRRNLKKKEFIKVYMTEDEKKEIEELAGDKSKKEGITYNLSEYIYSRIFEKVKVNDFDSYTQIKKNKAGEEVEYKRKIAIISWKDKQMKF